MIRPYWHVYMEEAASGEEGGGGEVDISLPGEGEAQPSMLETIDQALGYGDQQAAEEKAAADTRATEEAAVKDRDAKAAAGDAQALQAKQQADDAAKAEAAKPKDLKTLELTPAEKKAMKPDTAARYEQVLGAVKQERARAEAAEQQRDALSQSRDAILGVLKETNTSDQDLSELLEFNRLVKSGTPQGLEQALQVIDFHRTNLLKALGRPGNGYDPLTEHPDLTKDVAEQKITQERALEIAASRRREAINQSNANRGAQQNQAQATQQKAAQDGLAGIERWASEIAKTDIDYKAKEEKILAEIQGIVKEYPPNLWLPTIKRLYSGIVISKAPTLPSGNTPLRSSGAKPGGPAPASMKDAIDQGLKYAAK